ncbi:MULTISPECIES: PilZ domain-containing protein [Corallincola]|uniref:PilZ domain-containing protein n=3 Tax=Corallincola TaxID=1775176 RepID=A0A368NR51_9GAMM|nr:MULTISPECIES: PilZ domain-containing protein [Corallincola]RCU52580.1 PilZ domain-containing protein [Corallincola holothuriorum]TAA48227.1 PilZ domain-containing protein [Corallincola spongiicola]TCI02478.1 PilZ domain-containing protein [Corallincola luteus]
MTDQYFSVPYRLPINVIVMPEATPIPDQQQLIDEIPEPFRLASEVSTLDQGTVRALRNMGDVADEISNFLELQARKINVIMGYLLSMQDDPDLRHHTVSFGASEFCYTSAQPLVAGRLIQVKIFLHDEAAAVFAYAEVISCDQDADSHLIGAKFVTLREEDHEMLIRATLHVQSKLLKQRAEQRKGDNG